MNTRLYKTLAIGLVVTILATLTAGLRADDKSAANTADAEALWKQIKDFPMPKPDQSRRSEPGYRDEFFKEVRKAGEKRGELARDFLKKFPDHSKKADALFVVAQSLAATEAMDTGEFRDVAMEFVKAAPKDERGSELLYYVAAATKDEKEQLDLYRRVVKDYPKSRAADEARVIVKQIDAIGKPFELSFTDAISGKKISVADLKGKVLVIDFWATWCGPCVAEMPEMKKLYAEYKSKGVEFIGVSLDAPKSEGGLDKLKDFVKENAVTWPQYYQGNGWESTFSKSWGIKSIPTMFVVDAEGNLYNTAARGKLDEILPKLLKKEKKK
jgi:thiol-disulfide isomerase/thioredoxin